MALLLFLKFKGKNIGVVINVWLKDDMHSRMILRSLEGIIGNQSPLVKPSNNNTFVPDVQQSKKVW